MEVPVLSLKHKAGFFSCCSVKLDKIVSYYKKHAVLPKQIDNSGLFSWYKLKDKKDQDITYEYFVDPEDLKTPEISMKIDFKAKHQYKVYKNLDFTSLTPLIIKYFSLSEQILNIVKTLEEKYQIDYDNTCVLFYRGNDKKRETKICKYNDIVRKAKKIQKQRRKNNQNPVRFLIQSDETEFINEMNNRLRGSFYFQDEIRHMTKRNNTVDKVFKETNHEFSKYYLAITFIMSKCKYIICGTGNCSLWIMLYRQHADNVVQFKDGKWYSKTL